MGKTQAEKNQLMNREIRRDKRRSKNKPDQVDRIRDHIIEGKKLWKTDERCLHISMLIYPKLCKGWPNADIRKYLKKELKEDLSVHSCNKWIRKTKKIFAGAVDSDPEVEKVFLIDMAKQAYQVAKKKGNGRDMTAATKLLAQLLGAFDKDGGLGEVYEKLALPPIVYSDNPEVLKEPVTEADYEDITETKSLPS